MATHANFAFLYIKNQELPPALQKTAVPSWAHGKNLYGYKETGAFRKALAINPADTMQCIGIVVFNPNFQALR